MQMRNEIDIVIGRREKSHRVSTSPQNILIQNYSRGGSPKMSTMNSNVNNNVVGSTSSPRASSASRTDEVTSTTTETTDRNRLRRRNFSHEPGMTRRCVCNLSQCASTNYMCKSERRILEDGRESEAGCFIEELPDTGSGNGSEAGSQHGVGVTESNGRVTSARRGCIEMLSREKQDMCSDHMGAPVHCCFKDMCNYPKTYYPPFNQNVNNNRLSFDSTGGGVQGVTPNLDHQVWLRAAVIAVPVCGLMILIVLIIVARRLLKSDDDLDYKESNMSGGMGRPNRNKGYNNYPGLHPPHQHVKPVFLEPQEFLLPSENHCCCHNNSSSSVDYSVPLSGGHPKNPSTISGETEELVNSIGQLSHCQCPESGNYCNQQCPPSLRQHHPPPMVHPKKFNLLSHLGLSRNSKDTNSNNARTYDV